VVVDGAAEVEIRGDNASMRDLSGRTPQWRRVECTSALPPNPVDFRFRRLSGRGAQQLVRDPRNGGAAVVRINDPQGGPEAYAFELTWGRAGWDSARRDYDRRDYRDGAVDDRLIRLCEEDVRREAARRYGARDVSFRRVSAQDNPGPRDAIRGIVEVRRYGNRVEPYRYSCAVNFDSGRIRSVQLDPIDR